jgi:hypothetical protein
MLSTAMARPAVDAVLGTSLLTSPKLRCSRREAQWRICFTMYKVFLYGGRSPGESLGQEIPLNVNGRQRVDEVGSAHLNDKCGPDAKREPWTFGN